MSRLKQRAAQKRKLEQQQQQATFWPELCRRIDAGQLIPIVGNDLFFRQIFDIDGNGLLSTDPRETNSKGWTVEEQLADAWAEEIGYPLGRREQMARVALYNRVVKHRDDRSAKTSYLHWLKETLLFLAEEDPQTDPDILEEQQDEFRQSSFSDMVVEFGYPKTRAGQTDTLDRLAKLKLPIYVTTSYFDFLERAILKNGRSPRTQICFWSGDPLTLANASHRTDHTFKPTPENPLVYHLFGLETYPESLVLTEDDHLDFLAKIAQDVNQRDPLLPLYLRQALTQSSLLLLGYEPHDWDFRVLFRGLINATPSGLRMANIALQVNPEDQPWVVAAEDIRTYLTGYFEKKAKQLNFTVEFDTTSNFMGKLWQEWDRWRR